MQEDEMIAHMSEQISGQVPCPAIPQMQGQSQMDGDTLPLYVQNRGAFQATWRMDHEVITARKMLQDKIFSYLQQHPKYNEWKERVPKAVRNLEEILFQNATSKEEFMDQEELGHWLPILANSFAQINDSRPTTYFDPSLLPHQGSVGHQPGLANNSAVFGKNSVLLPEVASGAANHAAHTHGLNFSHMSLASAFVNTDRFSNVETIMASQRQQPFQYLGSQSSHTLHAISCQMDVGAMSSMQQMPLSYGFPSAGLNCEFTYAGNKIQLNNPESGNCLNPSQDGNSWRFSQQHVADAGFRNAADVSVYENFRGHVTPDHIWNNQCVDVLGFQSQLQMNSSWQAHQSNLEIQQQATQMPEMFDHPLMMKVQAPCSIRDHLARSFQLMPKSEKIQQRPHHPDAWLDPCLSQQDHQLLLENDTSSQTQTESNLGGTMLTVCGAGTHTKSLQHEVPGHCQLSEFQSQHLQNISSESTICSYAPQEQTHTESLQHEVPGHCQLSEFQSQRLQNISSESTICSYAPQEQHSIFLHTSDQLANHAYDSFSGTSHTEPAASQVQQPSHSGQKSLLSKLDQRSVEPQLPKEFSQVVSGAPLGRTPRKQLPLEINAIHRFLAIYVHSQSCTGPAAKCQFANCKKMKHFLEHMPQCNGNSCTIPCCPYYCEVLQHYHNCQDNACTICGPVRASSILHPFNSGLRNLKRSSWRTLSDGSTGGSTSKVSGPTTASGNLQFPLKRMKMEHLSPSLMFHKEQQPSSSQEGIQPHQQVDTPISVDHMKMRCDENTKQERDVDFDEVKKDDHQIMIKSAAVNPSELVPHIQQEYMQVQAEVGETKLEVKIKLLANTEEESPANSRGIGKDFVENVSSVKPFVDPDTTKDLVPYSKQEKKCTYNEFDESKMELRCDDTAAPGDYSSGTKLWKPKMKAVSMIEVFLPEQIKEHILSLRQWIGQRKAKVEQLQAMAHSTNEKSCQLCEAGKLSFEPPAIYCSSCAARIKRNAVYYTTSTVNAGKCLSNKRKEARNQFCNHCYTVIRSESFRVDGIAINKAKLEKKRNDEKTEEEWVQCDKCEAWQHVICALFNGKRNDKGQAEYTCPNCYLCEIESGVHNPLPQTAILGAKDLPRTILSDHIEERLGRCLKQEKQERARILGKNPDEVPGAEGLVVRVVSSADKKLEVKQRFLEIFQNEKYPAEFLYKSKVIILFQKIDGVEVCLFAMYFQEFGSECQSPNQRRVYISYLDSVKYFRPEIKACTGEALRTFVYHEILIGYLDYCKKRGFTSCYIWACPPLKGEDYIFYCHPEIQKTPKSDKLREWYLAMLRKASKENIVVNLTNLYEHFFLTTGECKAKVTAARLPYFDGDYLPGAMEDIISLFQQEDDGNRQQKKGKQIISKRALKAAGHTDLSDNAAKDIILMQKLGETIYRMREDCIMVHLQHPCAHCCQLIVSGMRWACTVCKNFQLCVDCYGTEQDLQGKERHPAKSREKHLLIEVEVNSVPLDTTDKDENIDSEFFYSRHAFLSLCEGNHFQYDTLRRAKHSSMMILYHLHNPTTAFVSTCIICHNEIEAGQAWHCEICPEYDVCHVCYQKRKHVDHAHELTQHLSTVDRQVQTKKDTQSHVLQLQGMLDLLVHASRCCIPRCTYPNCRRVKGLFCHSRSCLIRVSGGCISCKKIWYLLQLHSRLCKESECHVPRCKDLKDHMKRLQSQSESRRRTAVMEMVRHREIKIAGNRR